MSSDSNRTEDYKRADSLLEKLLDLDLREREQILDAECGGDAELRAQVTALLAAAEDSDRLLQSGGALKSDLIDEFTTRSRVSSIIGRYELEAEIGRGGMGVVYRGKRADGAFEQTVAVKLLKPGASQAAIERFTFERQVLATLDHPGIARLLDGGVTEFGEPFLVVEYVEGQSIEQYCVDNNPSIHRRLRILAELCSAVHAAHRQLIVHRDIKPANILITPNGQPKLLDFGIAKLVEGASLTALDMTETRGQAMTLQYASPEQYRGLPITVASDVYQLGLVAYEVLSGTTPYSLSDTPPSTTERLITLEEPPPPSSVLPDPRRRRQLGGDIDTIVMKAIRKEPERRYQSADELEGDIERHLSGHPIRARGNSTSYRALKFVRRHAVPVALLSTLGATLLISSIVFTLQLVKERDRTRVAAERAIEGRQAAEQALSESEQVLNFVVGLFGVVTPDETQGDQVSAIELLDASRSELASGFSDYPSARGRLLSTLGRLYQMRGKLDTSEELYNEAIDATQEALVSQPDDQASLQASIAADMTGLGKLDYRRGKNPDAIEHFQEALALLDQWSTPRSRHRGPLLTSLALAQLESGEAEAALANAQLAAGILKETLGPDHGDTVSAQRVVGDALGSLGRLAEAKTHLMPIVESVRRTSPESSKLVGALNALAVIEGDLGNYEERLGLLEESATIARRLFEPGHIYRLRVLTNLGNALQRVSRFDEAEAVLLETLLEAAAVGNQASEAGLRDGLARTFTVTGRPREALEQFDRIRELNRMLYPAEHRSVAYLEYNRSLALRQLGRLPEAEAGFRKAISIAETAFGENHPFIAHPLLDLAALIGGRDEHKAAEALARRAFLIRDKALPVDAPDRQFALDVLIYATRQLGSSEAADGLERFRAVKFEDSEPSSPESR